MNAAPEIEFSYAEVSEDVKVQVQPYYIEERSKPEVDYYFYAYRIRIHNQGKETVQILRRKWIIRDGEGDQEIVEGDGLVGQKPMLLPGEDFEYISFCPLRTPTGNMRGEYLATIPGKGKFYVRVPVFFFRDQNAIKH